MKTLVAVIVVAAVLAGGAWWWLMQGNAAPANTEQQSTSSDTNSRYAYIPDNLLLGTDATTSVGTYLIGSSGMTLYTYAKDVEGASNCTGQCASVWPPYTISSRDVLQNVQAGITGKVDAITRADGTMQVTYAGEPLYYYVQDKTSDDIKGQNVGSVWFVAKP